MHYPTSFAPPPHPAALAAQPAFATAAPPGTSLKGWYAALSVVAGVLGVLLLASDAIDLPSPAFAVLRVVRGGALLAALVVGLVWVGRAWVGVPPELVGRMTVAEAVLRLSIPVYGFYWMFTLHQRLCDALDAVLTRTGHPAHAPKKLALVAASVTLVSAAGSSLGPVAAQGATFLSSVLWWLYMARCDAARREACVR